MAAIESWTTIPRAAELKQKCPNSVLQKTSQKYQMYHITWNIEKKNICMQEKA